MLLYNFFFSFCKPSLRWNGKSMHKDYLWSVLCLDYAFLASERMPNMEVVDSYGLGSQDKSVYRTKVMMYLLRL
ncbi:hypothetical protein GDO81_014928 [Engystomops pustulosus]|uniref:Uncharacterized protein n=1 Tax=Engystomops pustulosus TaxID=76066 RepID=A0AAV7AFL6_ENGPU|nr:hypothetical protein GDO81_014928 [Engystomops pustulosus]